MQLFIEFSSGFLKQFLEQSMVAIIRSSFAAVGMRREPLVTAPIL
jgi:hypothetical protein